MVEAPLVDIEYQAAVSFPHDIKCQAFIATLVPYGGEARAMSCDRNLRNWVRPRLANCIART